MTGFCGASSRGRSKSEMRQAFFESAGVCCRLIGTSLWTGGQTSCKAPGSNVGGKKQGAEGAAQSRWPLPPSEAMEGRNRGRWWLQPALCGVARQWNLWNEVGWRGCLEWPSRQIVRVLTSGPVFQYLRMCATWQDAARESNERPCIWIFLHPYLPWSGGVERPALSPAGGRGRVAGQFVTAWHGAFTPCASSLNRSHRGPSTRTVDRAALPGQFACKKESEHQEHDYLRRLGHCPVQPPTPLDRPVL
jgi:hypothetical protein